MNSPLRVAIIGLGGFAREHHKALLKLEREGICCVVAACDPDPLRRESGAADFQFGLRGVRVFADYREMLTTCGSSLEMATVPTPIPLHAEMHRACVEAGVACYLEKPPTCYDVELEEMMAVEAGAKLQTNNRQTNIGFNFIIEPQRQALKRRMLAGEFGTPREVRLLGLWPRTDAYFQRSPWAGRLMMDNRPVLDSIFGNAMAHYTHNVLFWAGLRELFDWSPVTQMTAEMYRAHAIEGTDTLFASAVTESDVVLRFAMTHACDGPPRHREEILCDDAKITYIVGEKWHIRWRDGREESGPTSRGYLLNENFTAYLAYVNGDAPRPLTTLTDSRPFVRLNTLAYVAAGHIAPVNDAHLTLTQNERGETFRAINGIESAAERFLAEGEFPSAQNRDWSRPGGSASDAARERLLPTIAAMLG